MEQLLPTSESSPDWERLRPVLDAAMAELPEPDYDARLFVIKNRFEAVAVIYALGLGGIERGLRYLDLYPGLGGWLLFAACTGAVFMAGAKILDCLKYERAEREARAPAA